LRLIHQAEEATGRPAFAKSGAAVWTTGSDANPGEDYYGILRCSRPPVVAHILERGFMSNAENARLLFERLPEAAGRE
jgi:hypothetical protein